MVIWVSPSLSINIKSKSSSVLKEFTEVEVIPPNSSCDNDSIKSKSIVSKSIIENTENKNLSSYMDHLKDSFKKYKDQRCVHIMKSILISEKEITKDIAIVHNCLYIPNHYYNETYENSVFHLQTMSQSDETNKDNETTEDFSFVKLKPFNSDNFLKKINVFNEYIPAIIPDCIKNKLCMQTGDLFVLVKCDLDHVEPEVIEISPVISNSDYSMEEMQNSFKSFILSNSTSENFLLINKMDVIELCKIKNMSCQVKFYPKSLKYISINCDTLRKCRIIVNSDKIQPIERAICSHKQLDLDNVCRGVSSFDTIIKNCVDILKVDIVMNNLCLKTDLKNRSIVLILGN